MKAGSDKLVEVTKYESNKK